MSLSSALNTAKSSLSATQLQTALVSRNIANANVEGATRKYANVVTGGGGRVEVRSVAQSANSTLYRNMLDSTASLEQSNVVKAGLTRIDELVGDIETGNTPAALVANLSDKLLAYAASSQSFDFARSAVDAARDVATALNEGSRTVDVIRRDADDELVVAAADMNDILAEIERLNREIVAGTHGNRDVTDAVDERDRKIAELSGFVGLNVQTRGANDVVIYTDSGVTLFDKVPRAVSFTAQPLNPGAPGNGLRIDGTLVTGPDAAMPVRSGRIVGLVTLRDEIAVTYQAQLDEIARGLVAATVETDASGSRLGMFTATGAVPTVAEVEGAAAIPGLAGRLLVDPAVVASPTKLRDGVNTVFNPTGAQGYADRLNAIVGALGAPRTFDAGATNALASGSLKDFAASSVSWLQDKRSGAIGDVEYKQTLLDRTKEALSNETGVNLDQETLRLLDLERSFQASSKILQAVDEMLRTLLNAF